MQLRKQLALHSEITERFNFHAPLRTKKLPTPINKRDVGANKNCCYIPSHGFYLESEKFFALQMRFTIKKKIKLF